MKQTLTEDFDDLFEENYISSCEPLRILIVAPTAESKNTSNYLQTLSDELNISHHEVRVFRHLLPSKHNNLKLLKTALDIRKALKEFKPDIINVFSERDSNLVGLATLGNKTPVVRTHCHFDNSKDSLFEKKIAGRIYSSSHVESSFRRDPKHKKKGTSLIREKLYSVEFRSYLTPKNEARKALNISESEVVISVFEETLLKQDLETCVESLLLLQNETKVPISLLLNTTKTKESFNHFDFSRIMPVDCRSEEEIATLVSASDIAIFPDSSSPIVNTRLAQSMMGMLPAICARTGDLPEISNGAGILYNPNNPQELVKAVHHLLSSPYEYKRAQVLGLRRIKTRFNNERLVQLTETFYNETIRQIS